MSAPAPVSVPKRATARPFLTMKVLRGLGTFVRYGWSAFEAGTLRLRHEDEADLFTAKRWVERMIPVADALRAKRRAQKHARSAA